MSDPYEAPKSDTTPDTNLAPGSNNRHGCLTAYLILMLIGNAVTMFMYLFQGDTIRATVPGMTDLAFILFSSIGLVNIICAIAIFRWKKWGFWGFAVTTLLVFILNLSFGIPITQSAGGLVGVAILYGVLHIGDENKGWPQLK